MNMVLTMKTTSTMKNPNQMSKLEIELDVMKEMYAALGCAAYMLRKDDFLGKDD